LAVVPNPAALDVPLRPVVNGAPNEVVLVPTGAIVLGPIAVSAANGSNAVVASIATNVPTVLSVLPAALVNAPKPRAALIALATMRLLPAVSVPASRVPVVLQAAASVGPGGPKDGLRGVRHFRSGVRSAVTAISTANPLRWKCPQEKRNASMPHRLMT
jgi:hypothetical protein